MTAYIILTQTEDGGWRQNGTAAQSSSPERALRLAGVGEGTHVAVPARSWKPLTVKIEQTTKITIG